MRSLPHYSRRVSCHGIETACKLDQPESPMVVVACCRVSGAPRINNLCWTSTGCIEIQGTEKVVRRHDASGGALEGK